MPKEKITELNLIPLEKLIPSKDVRKQCEKEGRIFDLREQATLVCNNTTLSNSERINLLSQISEKIKAEGCKCPKLLEQIEQYKNHQKYLLKRFYSTEELQYFEIQIWDRDSESFEDCDVAFSSINKAFDYVQSEKMDDFESDLEEILSSCPLQITKRYMNDEWHKITCLFKNTKEPFEMESYSIDALPWDSDFFENAYILMPHPFRLGDFVKTIGTNQVGILRGSRTEEEYQKDQAFYKKLAEKGISDFTDVCCTADYLEPCYDNKKQFCFSHHHPSLVNLEFAEIKEEDPHYELMKQAQALVRGKGSLEMFSAEILKN